MSSCLERRNMRRQLRTLFLARFESLVMSVKVCPTYTVFSTKEACSYFRLSIKTELENLSCQLRKCCGVLYPPFLCVFISLLFSNLWTSRGHRCQPGTCLRFYRTAVLSIPNARRFPLSFANSRLSRVSAGQFLHMEKSRPTKSALVATRVTH